MVKHALLICSTLLAGCSFGPTKAQLQSEISKDLGFMFMPSEAYKQRLKSREPSVDLIDAILADAAKHDVKVHAITAFKADISATNYLVFTEDAIYVTAFNFGRLIRKGKVKLLSRIDRRRMNETMLATQPCQKYYQRIENDLNSDFHYFHQDGFNWLCKEPLLMRFDGNIRVYVKTIFEPDLHWEFYTQGPLIL